MSNKPSKQEQAKRDAFIKDMQEIERKHGMKLTVYQPAPQIVIQPIKDEEQTAN
jgi:hypothetical protein